MTVPAYFQTPFHARLAQASETNLWERWGAYTTASVVSEVGEEYTATRTSATLYDTSPLRKYRIRGRDAVRFVDRLATRDMTTCKVGQVVYACWCDDDGKVIEDGTIFRLAEDTFQVNAQEPQLRWFQDTAHGLDVAIEEVTTELASLALQGPLSGEILGRLALPGVDGLRYFRIVDTAFGNVPLQVSRTGFTGDLGYELWVAPDHAIALWDALMAAAAPRRLLPMGSAALNMTRIEAGFVMVNAEFKAANVVLRPSQRRSPYELGLEWTVDLAKDHFVGRRALALEAARGGPARRLVGIEVEGRKPASEAFLYDGKREIGLVTSATWSPVLKKNIALASVDAEYAAPGARFQAEIWYRKEMKFERSLVACTVIPRPFFDPPRKRA